MHQRRFIQCDVFTDQPTRGNGLAVVVDAEGLDDRQMQDFAAWTNLAETTFLLPPTDPVADYQVRIFTPTREMPFAGHPTLGSCAAWLHAGGKPKQHDLVRQECAVGIVEIDLRGDVPVQAVSTARHCPDHVRSRSRARQCLPMPTVSCSRPDRRWLRGTRRPPRQAPPPLPPRSASVHRLSGSFYCASRSANLLNSATAVISATDRDESTLSSAVGTVTLPSRH